jgi:subtilisin-like proprotein convertase family protein
LHSAKYGFGRLNALRAVQLAQPQAQNVLNVQRTFDLPIPDLQTVSFTLDVTDATPVEALAVKVDLTHTFISDLVIELKPPVATGAGRVTLHNRAGGSAHDLKKTYDAATTPGLGNFVGKSCKGTWTLTIRDAAALDSGRLASFGLVLTFPHQDRAAVAPKTARKARKRPRKKVAKQRR